MYKCGNYEKTACLQTSTLTWQRSFCTCVYGRGFFCQSVPRWLHYALCFALSSCPLLLGPARYPEVLSQTVWARLLRVEWWAGLEPVPAAGKYNRFNITILMKRNRRQENFSVLRHPDRWFHTSIRVQPSSHYCWTQTDWALMTENTCCKVGMSSSLMPHLAETQSTVSPVPARELSFHALLVLHLQLLVDLLILRSCRINSVTAGTPAASVLSSHGQIWAAGMEQRGCVNRTGHNRCG